MRLTFAPAKKLAQRRLARAQLSAWRHLRDGLLEKGVPSAGFRVDLGEAAAFCWDPAKSRTVVYMPLQSPLIDQVQCSEKAVAPLRAFVLLHEWGHAFLHPPQDSSWAERLSPKARLHADPAWLQVGSYLGWQVFNEIFADTFAAGALLFCASDKAAAKEALEAVYRLRAHRERHFDHPALPCVHASSSAIAAALESAWTPARLFEQALVISDVAFCQWLEREKNSGEALCQSSLIKLRFQEQCQGRSLVNIRLPGFTPTPALAARLQRLQQWNSAHPLLKLRSAQQCLEMIRA